MKKRGTVRMQRAVVGGIEATVADTTQAFARHSHDRFGLGVVTRGGQRSASGCGLVEARAGDAITVNPGEVHDGSPLDERGRRWQMLYFEPAYLHGVAQELGAAAPQALELERPVLRDAAFVEGFERAFAAAVDSGLAVDTLAREEAVFRFVAQAVARYTTVRAAASVAVAQADLAVSVARARLRIDDDPATAVTLTSLADEAGVSRFQLLRGFARETGLPPHAYLVQRRIALARRLIAGGLPLADAAVNAGFADQSHMTRAFVRASGITPAQYAAAVR